MEILINENADTFGEMLNLPVERANELFRYFRDTLAYMVEYNPGVSKSDLAVATTTHCLNANEIFFVGLNVARVYHNKDMAVDLARKGNPAAFNPNAENVMTAIEADDFLIALNVDQEKLNYLIGAMNVKLKADREQWVKDTGSDRIWRGDMMVKWFTAFKGVKFTTLEEIFCMAYTVGEQLEEQGLFDF